MELNNGKNIHSTIIIYKQIILYYSLENELLKKISDNNDRELELLKTKEKSSQERVQCLEDKMSLLTGGTGMCLLILYHCKC